MKTKLRTTIPERTSRVEPVESIAWRWEGENFTRKVERFAKKKRETPSGSGKCRKKSGPPQTSNPAQRIRQSRESLQSDEWGGEKIGKEWKREN